MVTLQTTNKSRKIHKFSLWDMIICVICAVTSIVIFYPFLNVTAVSLADSTDYLQNPLMFWPTHWNFDAYVQVLQQKLVRSGYINTIVTTVVGTLLSMTLTATLAYPLSRKDLRGGKFFSGMLIFTMMFNGGLIPNYLLINGLGIFNTIWALIIPSTLSAYNCILMRKFFLSIPESLTESATIDGANDMQIFLKIILPLSTPILATITLFYAVSRWNMFFQAIVYVRDRSLWTLQLVLREIVISSQAMEGDITSYASPRNIKYAVIVVATLPILCVYPFIQKYFVKGIMLGAVKG